MPVDPLTFSPVRGWPGDLHRNLAWAQVDRALPVARTLSSEAAADPPPAESRLARERRLKIRSLNVEYTSLADALLRMDRLAGAERACREALYFARRLAEDYPHTPLYEILAAEDEVLLATILEFRGRAAAAQKMARSATVRLRQLIRRHPDRRDFLFGLVHQLGQTALFYLRSGRPDKAERCFDEATAHARRLHEADPSAPHLVRQLSALLVGCASLRILSPWPAHRDVPAGEAMMAEAVALWAGVRGLRLLGAAAAYRRGDWHTAGRLLPEVPTADRQVAAIASIFSAMTHFQLHRPSAAQQELSAALGQLGKQRPGSFLAELRREAETLIRGK